jgi:hypothetical protein
VSRSESFHIRKINVLKRKEIHMFKAKQSHEGTELARRIKNLVNTLTLSYRVALDKLPFDCGRFESAKSQLVIEDLFRIAKDLDPQIERDEEHAKKIYYAIYQGTPSSLDEFYNILTGLKFDAFRVGYFAGVLMGAQGKGASEERTRLITARLYERILAEGFELAPRSKPALKAA